MIEIFKTNVKELSQARELVVLLNRHFPEARINFDLHDCDKILRVEGKHFNLGKIINLVHQNGFSCSLLD